MLSAVFDMDYADGYARANTNLWVFDDSGQLVLIGGDSNTLDDRPIGRRPLDGRSVAGLGRGPGPVHRPRRDAGESVNGLRRRYYVAVSSNAQFRRKWSSSSWLRRPIPLVRLEPVNSVNRIAEDHIATTGNYTTAEAPTVPVLFGGDDVVTCSSRPAAS